LERKPSIARVCQHQLSFLFLLVFYRNSVCKTHGIWDIRFQKCRGLKTGLGVRQGHWKGYWTPQSEFPDLTFTDVSGHCWIIFGQARATVMRATRNGVSSTTNYVTVETKSHIVNSWRQTSSTHWRNLTAVYCAYMKQMRLPLTGWQHMALSTHTYTHTLRFNSHFSRWTWVSRLPL